MKVNWTNPYKNKGSFWLKGNLHTHTKKSPCGRVEINRVFELFAKKGFDFLAISDHWLIFDQATLHKDLIILPGIEVDIKGKKHKCIINTSKENIVYKKSLSHQVLIDKNIKRGAVVTLNHPDWQEREHYTIDELKKYRNFTGIEIFNAVIEHLAGSPLSTAKWDRLLSSGHRCLGFASQDFHFECDLSETAIVVNVKQKTAKGILRSIEEGNFYSFNGVYITEIKRTEDTISVKTRNAGLIRFIGFYGTTIKKVYARSAKLTFSRKDPRFQYIRVECLGSAGKISWTQPFFRE